MPFRVVFTALLVAMLLAFPARSEAQRCDRVCLSDFITGYLNAMLAHDPERTRRLGEAGRSAFHERFTLERMVAGYDELFDEVLSR